MVVDDKREHLDAIVQALAASGASTLAIKYEPGEGLRASDFVGVRCLFLDLQLLSNARTSDYAQHFAFVQQLLEENISVSGGPYVLVLWTSHAEQATALSAYLETNFAQEKGYARPLVILPLPKTDYIDLDTGTPRELSSLVEAINSRLRAEPSLAALLQWEVDVMSAAGGVLNDLVSMTPAEDGITGGVALAAVMKRLSLETVGESNLARDVEGALRSALLPLLNDRLQNLQSATNGLVEMAFSTAPATLPPLSAQSAAEVNSRLHLDLTPVTGSEWGAVSVLGDQFDWPSLNLDDVADFLKQMKVHTVLPSIDPAEARPVRVRIGAACDYAQRPTGPIPYVLGVMIPADAGGKSRKLVNRSPLWISPVVSFEGVFQQIAVHPRFTFAGSPKLDEKDTTVFRLKEQILMELIAAIAGHESRPGIVRFSA